MNEQSPRDPRLAAAVEGVAAALQKNDQAQAIRLARSALDLGLVHPLLLNLRAFWLEGRGRMNDALADLERARDLVPDDVPVLNALGLAYTKLHRPIEAAKEFEKVIALQPDFTPVYFNHGWACELWGELNKAKQSYEIAVARSQGTRDSAEPLARLATLAVRRGDWAEAREIATRTLKLAPNHPIARLAQLRANIQTGELDQAEEGLREILALPTLDPNDRYQAMGALGDLRDREGRHADAFAAYSAGNAEWRKIANTRYGYGKRLTGLGALQWMHRFYEKAQPLPKAPPASAPQPTTRHVFLLGFIRSGTTLLEQVLASHPDVVTMEEKEALGDSGPQYLANDQGLMRLQNLSDADRTRHVEAYWQRVREQGLDPVGKIFIDKQPFNTVKLPLIAALFPDAKILFAVRDPRDVLLSCLRQRFLLTALTYELLTLEDAAQFYDAYMRLADELRRVLPLDLHQIRHEDFVDDFEGEGRKVCEFLGIEWTDAMRDFAERRKVRAITTPSAAQIAKGLNREGMGRWRKYAEQMAPIQPVLKPWLEHFGYPTT